MHRIFVKIYNFFRRHRPVFWVSMFSSFAIFLFMASKIHLEENITSFFPSGNSSHMAEVYSNLKVSDKILIMFSSTDGSIDPDKEDSLFSAAARFGELVEAAGVPEGKYLDCVSGDDISGMLDFVGAHLPVLMEDSDYESLARLDNPAVVDSAIRNVYLNLISPAGFAVKDVLMSDPLSIGGGVLGRTAELNPVSDYQVRANHVFTPDGNTLLAFLEPAFSSGETGNNDALVAIVDAAVDSLAAEFPTVEVHYFGGPAMSVYNARQIKRDTYATSIVALVIIILFILCVFKRRRSIFLILCPAIYGAVFALAMSWLTRGSISGIAVGAGTAIMGIALSYSIHFLAHQNYVRSVTQLLEELCSPLIIGSVTTIGAFVGLLFTSSRLLQDFGLFAAYTLLGTMVFCLVFLPQFLVAQSDVREGKVLRIIEKISSYPFDRNKWLIAALVILTAVCGYMSTKVGFDSDMMDLTYWEPKLKEAEAMLAAQDRDSTKTVMLVNVGASDDLAYNALRGTLHELEALKSEGLVSDYSDGGAFVAGHEEQMRRIGKWKAFWTPERVASVSEEIRSAAVKYGFREDAFDGAIARLSADYQPVEWFDSGDSSGRDSSDRDSSGQDSSGREAEYSADSLCQVVGTQAIPMAFSSWMGSSDNLKMFVCQATMRRADIDEVYSRFYGNPNVVIFDQSYFANKAAESINNDFYLILFISSFLIFFVLWLSYGRLELALLSFLPMAVSWIIITGIMEMLGVQFNIVNIILSTFIFGMGDDFSIFIMDGLLHKYRTGRELVNSHKSAIFFSSFVMIVGIGALIFAKHPALHSIALITILGMVAVVLVAYVAEPVIFREFVTKPASEGKAPYTFGTVFGALFFLYIPAVLGGAVILLIGMLLQLVPIGRERRQTIISLMLHHACRLLVWICPFIKSVRLGPDGKRLRQWTGSHGIVCANHQSSLDIILLISLFPKVKFFVADWVRNSPLFNLISGLLGYICKSDGLMESEMVQRVATDLEHGWNYVIFPEGTRSRDGSMKRFHKGAFLLADVMKAPMIPVVFYGNWRICPKGTGLNLTRGVSVTQVLPFDSRSYETITDVRKAMKSVIVEAHEKLCREYDSPRNPYFRKVLVSSYLYKGPVTEWYVKVKTSLEDDYAYFDSMLPRTGQITDIGCGMGQLDIMLSLLHPSRKVLGLDYDEEKIAVARNCWPVRNLPGLSFVNADAQSAELPESDAFVISDMLHYIDSEAQERLIRRCVSRLKDGGLILLRDSDTGNVKGQKMTAFSEVLSTKIMGFNKTSGDLHFISEAQISGIAKSLGLSLEVKTDGRKTSNTFYLLRKRACVGMRPSDD